MYLSSYHKYAVKLQNRDGSFSTSWFEKRDGSGDIELGGWQTTGHILEWMVFSLPEEDLTDPRIIKSVNFLANLLISNRNREWEIGPQGHASRVCAVQ